MPTAINIALLLPDAWANEARRLNALLPGQPNPVPLAGGQAVPHVTLAMAVVDDDTLKALPEQLRLRFAEDYRCTLQPKATYLQQETAGLEVSGLAIEHNTRLQTLHERLFELVLELGWVMPTMGAIKGSPGEKTDPRTLDLIRRFRDFRTYDNYRPHVTLGTGALPPGEAFREGTAQADHLGLFVMGNLCTCREELYRLDLADNHDIAGGGFEGGWRIEG